MTTSCVARRHADTNLAARGRELDRVGEQVAHHLLQPVGVGGHVGRALRRQGQGHVFPLGRVPHGLHRGCDDLRGVHALHHHVHLARDDARDVQDVRRELGLDVRVPLDRLQGALAALLVEVAGAQQVGPSHDRGQRVRSSWESVERNSSRSAGCAGDRSAVSRISRVKPPAPESSDRTASGSGRSPRARSIRRVGRACRRLGLARRGAPRPALARALRPHGPGPRTVPPGRARQPRPRRSRGKPRPRGWPAGSRRSARGGPVPGSSPSSRRWASASSAVRGSVVMGVCKPRCSWLPARPWIHLQRTACPCLLLQPTCRQTVLSGFR